MDNVIECRPPYQELEAQILLFFFFSCLHGEISKVRCNAAYSEYIKLTAKPIYMLMLVFTNECKRSSSIFCVAGVTGDLVFLLEWPKKKKKMVLQCQKINLTDSVAKDADKVHVSTWIMCSMRRLYFCVGGNQFEPAVYLCNYNNKQNADHWK